MAFGHNEHKFRICSVPTSHRVVSDLVQLVQRKEAGVMLTYQDSAGLYTHPIPFGRGMFLAKNGNKIYRNDLLAILEPKSFFKKSIFVFQAPRGNEVREAEEENLVSLPLSCSVSFMLCLGYCICSS